MLNNSQYVNNRHTKGLANSDNYCLCLSVELEHNTVCRTFIYNAIVDLTSKCKV